MNKQKIIIPIIVIFLAIVSTAIAASTQSTNSNVYVLNSAPTVRTIIATSPAEVGVTTMSITANITDPNGIPGDFGTATATYNDGTSDISTVYLTYNSGTGLYENNTFTIPAQSTIGTWTVTVNGTDLGGLSDTNSTTFTVQDTVAPIVSNLQPANGTNYPKNTEVPTSIIINDNGTINDAHITVTGPGTGLPTNVALTYNVSSGKYEGILSASYTDVSGTYNMTTYADDTGSNTGNVLTGYVTMGDVVNPVINSVSDSPDPVDPGQIINITANVTDNIAVDKVTVDIDGTNYTMTYDSTSGLYYYDQYDTYKAPGTYNYKVYANDTTGNEATPVSGTFTINTQVAITLSQVPIDFGNTTVPVTQRRADDGTAGSGYSGGTIKGFPAVINNTGNVNINLSINGTDLVGQTNGAYTVDVSNVEYNTTSTPGTALSSTATTFATGIPMTNAQSIYFWITLPEGLISQEYQGTVNIYATQS